MSFGALLQDEQQQRSIKSVVLVIVFCAFFILLIARMFYVQVVQAQTNIRLSKENAMRLKVLFPTRGRIIDRNGIVLARSRPSYSICVLPYKLKNHKSVVSSLCLIRDQEGEPVFDSTDLELTIKKAMYRRFDITRLKEDVSLDLVSIIEEHSMELPGIIVETESRREYTLGQSAFHVLGYMGEIPESQFDTLKEQGYKYGDLIGKSGIERQYETVIRGECGIEYIEVNAYGKSLGSIDNIPRVDPIPGKDIYLTIDSRLQKVADIAFNDTLKGAIVALDPRNGEVLIMFSSPSVDPNIFSMSTSLRSKNWSEIATDSNLPLNNRVIGGTYIPGSTFKIVSALAGLESANFTMETYMPSPCRGAYRIGSRIAHCWNLSGHGSMDLVAAIKQSCNIYFYQVGLRLGDQVINSYAEMLGLGSQTGIDLPGERTGWLSGEEAYNKRFARRKWKWTRGLVLDLAIGQAQILTPLQLALMVGGIANAKAVYKPYLAKEVRNSDGAVLKQYHPELKKALNLKETTVEALSTALEAVIKAGGTGGRASVPGIPVGGKTGSAENSHGDLTHALFVACAPVKDPVIAIAIVVENAGGGGAIAAPIGGDVLRYFFAETDEGKQIMQQINPGNTKVVEQLQKSVQSIKDQLALETQNEEL